MVPSRVSAGRPRFGQGHPGAATARGRIAASAPGPSLAQVLDDGVVAGTGLVVVATPAVVVGPVRPGFPGVTWVLEEPAGSGPLAAVAVGAHALPEEVDRVL